MGKHILKENIKVKGFKKKNEHKVKQTKNKTEQRERERERLYTYCLWFASGIV